MFDWKKLILLNLIVLNIALVILALGGLISPQPTLANPAYSEQSEQIMAQNLSIQKWEYWRIKLRNNSLEEDWNTVIETGKNGWEMVNCGLGDNDSYILCFFKRPI